MDLASIITVGNLILQGITFVESLFGSKSEANPAKKSAVTSVAEGALLSSIPGMTPDLLQQAAAEVDGFIEAGVALQKAIEKIKAATP